jgi:plastocyanin
MMSLLTRATAGVLMSALLLAATAAGSAEKADKANAVSIKGMKFQPASFTVPAGATVVWTNFDGEPHTVVSASGTFRSNALDQDDRFTFRFDKPGTYYYICTIHPMMTGTIVVK